MDVIYLDFQKAFDKVPHQRLLIKLKSHGMGVNIVTWIQNWLTDRKQRVKARSHRHRETRNEKRETRKLSCNQKSAARRFFFSERENLDDFQDRQPTDFLPPRKILTNQREVQQRKHHRRLQAVMDASGADKLILLVQTNQVLYDKPATGYKVKDG